MTTRVYDRSLFAFQRVSGSSKLNWTARLGEMRLGMAADTRTPVAAAKVTINDGYTIGSSGELSLDPSTATASISSHVTGPVTATVPTLRVGDPVEISYQAVVLFKGTCTQLRASVDADATEQGYTRSIVYTLTSVEAVLLGETVAWDSLPAESALVRLRRWFTVDVGAVALAHRPRLDLTVPAEAGPGSASLLNLARAFTEATLVPLRINPYYNQDWRTLAAFDAPIAWADQPLTITTGFTTAEDWTTAADFQTPPGGATLAVTAMSVKADDMRLTQGVTTFAITPDQLGSTFRLGTSRLGTTLNVPVGLLAPAVIDAYGTPAVASRLIQNFGEHYSASIEFAPTLTLDPSTGA